MTPQYFRISQSAYDALRSKSETLLQNYRRLGLASKLNSLSGGIEPSHTTAIATSSNHTSRPDPLSVAAHAQKSKSLIPTTARIIRDLDSGAIKEVIHPTSAARHNPLNDPLNDLESEDEHTGNNTFTKRLKPNKTSTHNRGIIPQLEAAAEITNERKRPRAQTQSEQEWIERLVERWGDNYMGMMGDKKLNPWQHSEGNLRRRVLKWKERREAIVG